LHPAIHPDGSAGLGARTELIAAARSEYSSSAFGYAL